MVKVKRKNVSYMIPNEQLKRFLSMGFVVVDDHVAEVEDIKIDIIPKPTLIEDDITNNLIIEEPIIEEHVAEKETIKIDVYRMKKVELIDYAIRAGVNLTGDETINDLRKLLKN